MRAHQILFVEDDVIASLASSDFLRDRGFRVIEVANAPLAATIINQRGYLSALVCDIDLGPGDDGFQIARQARIAHPELPVVFISAMAASRHMIEGVNGSVFIQKPYHPRQVLEALRALSPSRSAA
ncbi:response regulator [Caulobacter sp. UNC279MFTsu5.1]|uniref:response regulator n=1 Tax=Caulobacter sp. UNC279MFTsu5.1 TaxID=1502775 RepID=UPI000B7D67F1|nr:response regulator [Caulobacter sp. UNC279MFTsu5.1]